MKKLNIAIVSILLILLMFTGCQPTITKPNSLTTIAPTTNIYPYYQIPFTPPVDHKDGWTIFTNSSSINGFLIDGDVIWEATSGGVVRWQPGTDTYWKYTTLDGLASNNIRCLTKDNQGNLWFGTSGGISRYDGNKWLTYTISDGLVSNDITAIAQDKNGNIWGATRWTFTPGTDIATYLGVVRFDGTNWRTFTTADGLASNGVTAIIGDNQGNVWFGTVNSVTKYDGSTWQIFSTKDGLPKENISPLGQDKIGNLWFAAGNSGVLRYDGKSWQHLDVLGSNSIGAMTMDDQGNLWFATWNNGVIRYDGTSWQVITKDGLPGNYIRAIATDTKGNVWCSTFKSDNGQQPSGIGYYDGHVWRSFALRNELPDNFISSVAEDGVGNIWCGTQSDGVGRFDGTNWKGFTTKDGLTSNTVANIFTDKTGKLWLYSSFAIKTFDGIHWVSPPDADVIANGFVSAVSRDPEGNIWIANNTAVRWYDGISWHTFATLTGVPGQVFNILRDTQGTVWLVDGNNKLRRFDGTEWQLVQPELPGDYVTSMGSDNQGNLWVGTEIQVGSAALSSLGVHRFDGKIWHTFDLDGAFISCIYQDKAGIMWFGASGLTRYDGKTWQTLTTRDGLAGNGVAAITEINGKLWIGTNDGLSCSDSNYRK